MLLKYLSPSFLLLQVIMITSRVVSKIGSKGSAILTSLEVMYWYFVGYVKEDDAPNFHKFWVDYENISKAIDEHKNFFATDNLFSRIYLLVEKYPTLTTTHKPINILAQKLSEKRIEITPRVVIGKK